MNTTPPPFELPAKFAELLDVCADLRHVPGHGADALASLQFAILSAVAERDAWWQQQTEALRADAERYRWLRSDDIEVVGDEIIVYQEAKEARIMLLERFLDEAIDAAIARTKEPTP